jgi:hypothetical protein
VQRQTETIKTKDEAKTDVVKTAAERRWPDEVRRRGTMAGRECKVVPILQTTDIVRVGK